MSYEERLRLAKDELRKSRIWKFNYEPPLLIILEKFGLKTRPPHYQSFLYNFLSNGVYFGVAWGILMYIFLWRHLDYRWETAVAASSLAGILFGFFMGFVLQIELLNTQLIKVG